MRAALGRHSTLLANLAVLLVLLVGMYHVGANILRLDIARSSYTVEVELAASGGLYPRSEVTYRGKRVGKVTELRLTEDGVIARLRIDSGTEIPTDTDVVVSNLSAAGEQFVDFRPRRAEGPYLTDGSLIAVERTQIPITTAALVRDVVQLLDQVDSANLRTVINELALAFEGTGPQLADLVDSSAALVASMRESLPETVDLISNARTNLDTANELSGQFDRFTSALRGLTRELRTADPQVRTLLQAGPGSIADIDTFVTELTTPASALLAGLITPGNLITARLPALEAMVVSFADTTAALRRTVGGGQFRIRLHLTDNNTCSYGGPRRTPIDATRVDPDLTRTCPTPTSVGARGAQNAPRPEPSGPGTPGYPSGTSSAGRGIVVLPDGTRYSLGPVSRDGSMTASMALLLALVRV